MGNYWLDLAFSPKLYLIELLEEAGCSVTESTVMGKSGTLQVQYKTAFTHITEGTWKNKKKKQIKELTEQILVGLKTNQIP